MKKGLLLLVLFILPLVSAVNINMKPAYMGGETIIGTIEGNFIQQLSPQNFYFYSDGVQIPLNFDIAKIQDKYYFYAQLPSDERNYTLVLKDVDYFENGKEIFGDIERNFTTSGIIDFSVYPGFLIMRNNSFITVESSNQPLTVSTTFFNSTQDTYIPLGQKKRVYLAMSGDTFMIANIEISGLSTKYSIPVAIIPPAVSSLYSENITETDRFRFSKSEYLFDVSVDNASSFQISLQNLGNVSIKDIKIDYSDTLEGTLTLSQKQIAELKESELTDIDLVINARISKTFIGTIRAHSENYSAETTIIINSTEPPLPPESGENTSVTPPVETQKETCWAMNGNTCLSGTTCVNGTLEDSLNGPCCVGGTCQAVKSYTGLIIGIIIIIGLLVGLYFLYKKIKKPTPPENTINKTQAKFDIRMKPRAEVRGNLSRS